MDLRLLRYFVAVAEERHVGRAAVRLHMTQPPLSRALQQLEAEVGTVLLHRSSTGVSLTTAGSVLYDEARALLEQAEQVRCRVAAAAGTAVFTLGTLGDSAGETGTPLVAAFREQHPHVQVRLREADFTDPTAGLRTGLVDVALTRAPFDETGIRTHRLRSDPVGVVLRADDPLAQRDTLTLADLTDRAWFQLPEGIDPVWRAYWNAVGTSDALRAGPVVRTVQECLQAVLWNATVGLAPLLHPLPQGLTSVPLTDMAPSRLILAWHTTNADPLVASFIRITAALYRSRTGVS